MLIKNIPAADYIGNTYRHAISSMPPFVGVSGRYARVLKARGGSTLGCSCGYFIDVALEEKMDAYGVEFSTVAIAAASEKSRERILQMDVNQLGTSQETRYDVVTAFDIIEHTHDPIQFLSNLKSILKEKGLLVITTHDTSHFLRSVMRQGWPMLQPFSTRFCFRRAHYVWRSNGLVTARLN